MEQRREIVPHPFGGWDVTDADGCWNTGYFATLSEAESAARAWLQGLGGGWLTIHGWHGTTAEIEVGGVPAS